MGRGSVTVWNLVHLLDLPEEVLELLERGALSKSHGTALLVAEDPRVRSRLAREAIERGWPTRTLEARAHASNMSEPKPKEGPEEVGLEGKRARERDAEQEPDLTNMNVARMWGDLSLEDRNADSRRSYGDPMQSICLDQRRWWRYGAALFSFSEPTETRGDVIRV